MNPPNLELVGPHIHTCFRDTHVNGERLQRLMYSNDNKTFRNLFLKDHFPIGFLFHNPCYFSKKYFTIW